MTGKEKARKVNVYKPRAINATPKAMIPATPLDERRPALLAAGEVDGTLELEPVEEASVDDVVAGEVTPVTLVGPVAALVGDDPPIGAVDAPAICSDSTALKVPVMPVNLRDIHLSKIKNDKKQ